jgi:hypothetical protein
MITQVIVKVFRDENGWDVAEIMDANNDNKLLHINRTRYDKGAPFRFILGKCADYKYQIVRYDY